MLTMFTTVTTVLTNAQKMLRHHIHTKY